MRTIFTILAVLLFSVTSVQASVVYNWHSTSGGEHVIAVDGRIVFTDAAYQAGAVDFLSRPPYFEGDYSLPIISMDMTLVVGGGYQVLYTNFLSYFGPDGDGLATTYFKGSFTMEPGGYLSGSFYSHGVSLRFGAHGTARSWTIGDVNSDYFTVPDTYCWSGHDTLCSGGTGYWKLDASTVPVPAPNMLGLLALLTVLALVARQLLDPGSGRRRSAGYFQRPFPGTWS